MLDRKFILENADLVQENCRRRGVEVDIARFVALEQDRRARQTQLEELNRQANDVSKSIGKAKDDAEREARKAEGRKLRDQVTAAQAELEASAAELDGILRRIPNLTHPKAPLGADDQSNVEVRRGKHAPPKFSFKPLDHVTLGERLNLVDLEAGARVAGHGFYFLKNEAVLLELALQQFAVNLLRSEGFTPVITPDLARNEVLHGGGIFHPRAGFDPAGHVHPPRLRDCKGLRHVVCIQAPRQQDRRCVLARPLRRW